MTEINSNMAYYPTSPSAAKKKEIGATIAGSLIGMNAYYLPIKKDVFVRDINSNVIPTSSKELLILQKMKQMPKSQL